MADETYQVTLDDGREVRVTVPAGSSQDAIYAAAENKARSNAAPAAPAPERDRPPVSDAATSMAAGNVPPPKQRAPNWVVDEMPFWQQAMAAYGGKAYGLGKGVQQLFTFGPKLEALRAEAAERAKRDAPLYDTAGGALGGVLHDVVMAASPIPFMKAATFARPTTQAAIGGTLGGLQESTDLGGTLVNTGLGAGFGAGGQAVANRVARGLTPQATTQAQQLAAQLLRQYNIRVDPGAISNNLITNVLRGLAGKEQVGQVASKANQPAITRAVAGQIGAPTDVHGAIPLTNPTVEKQLLAAALARGYDPIKHSGPYLWTQDFEKAIRSMTQNVDDPVARAAVERLSQRLDTAQMSGESILKELRRARQLEQAAAKSARSGTGGVQAEELRGAYGTAQDALADLIKANQVKFPGQPNLFENLVQARKDIAQLNNAFDALTPVGHIDARVLARQLGEGVPLSGPMLDIARGASPTVFSSSFAPGAGAIPGSNALLTNIGAMGGAAGGGSAATQAATVAFPWLRRPFANMVTSPAYLQHWANPATSIPGRLNRALTGGNTALLGEYLRRGAGPVSAGAGDDLYDIYTGR